MRALSLRIFVCVSLLFVPAVLSAANVTVSGTTTFAALDGGADDADHAHNGVFTVNGNLTVNGSITCNDSGGGSACPMSFNVSGDVLLNPGSSLYAENRQGNGNGANITLTVGGNLLLKGNSGLTAGALVSSYATGSSHSNGGNITANVGGTMTTEKGSIVDVGSRNATAGKINLVSGGPASIDGSLLSGPGRTFFGGELDGGTPNASGGEIHVQSTSFVEPGVTINSNALVISQSGSSSGGPVTIDGCGIIIKGIVLGLGEGSGTTRVAIRSGKSILIDSRDLGVLNAPAGRYGHVGSDALGGTAANNSVGIYAGTSITILGPNPATSLLSSFFYSLSAFSSASNGSAGKVRVISLGDTVTVSGNAVYASDSATGADGGTVEISGKGNLNLDTMVVRATGDFVSNSANRHGGAISARSHSGNVVWTNGTGDARPTGSSVPATVRGTITLTACGTISTSGSTFPTNGAPVGTYPAQASGNCSPAAPSLPATEPALQTCNTPPTANSQSVTTLEDNAVTITMTASDPDNQPLTFSIVTPPAHGSLGPIMNATATSAQVVYTPNANYNGNDSFTFMANDGNGGTATGIVSITVTPVNDAPSFNTGTSPQTSLEDAGPQFVSPWASGISAGPADESTQHVTFTITGNTNPALFSAGPSVSPSGALSYTAAPNANGSASISVVAHDDGGTANGGVDTSAPQNFTINIIAVNDAPSFTKGADQNALEDSGPHSVSGWATAINAGPADEAGQSVSFNVTGNSNPALFSAGPAVAPDGTLTYTPAPNANGSATISVAAHDNGGTANGGVDTSASQSFTITVVPVNDAPSFTKGADVAVSEDSGAYTQAAWATAISAGPADEAGQTLSFNASNSNNALFAVQPTVAPNGTLTFTPAANATGSATVTLSISDNGGTANGGVDTSASQTFVITVNGVNDGPSFTKGADQTSFEDGGPQVVSGWATAISAGPADESSQTVTFSTTNDNNPLFAVQPAVASDGTLTYTAAANAYGTATVTVVAHDDGGTANGGVDTSAPQTFTITITPVNDAPSFTGGGNVSALEDSGAYSQSGWATAISDGPNESGQTLTFHVSNDNNALFSVQPVLAPNGTLTFTLATNAFGSANVTVTLQDDGGTANGGADTSAPQTFTIGVIGVNDAPSFTRGADQSSFEDAGPQTVVGWATAISAGPGEGSQTVDFVVSNDNNTLFSVQPAVSPNGTLTYAAAPNANGTATVTVAIHDDGGTANGGVDTSAT
ncbi:MAG: hypothetical protein JWO56_613, partial [Acidobacteria bacterium]|nr:hypothetical protein [Acidobacteriota bacterium]